MIDQPMIEAMATKLLGDPVEVRIRLTRMSEDIRSTYIEFVSGGYQSEVLIEPSDLADMSPMDFSDRFVGPAVWVLDRALRPQPLT